MRILLIPAALALAVAAAWPAQPVLAKGCLKGAVVGGLAGHLAHHGVLGAMAGCAVGHHEANKHRRGGHAGNSNTAMDGAQHQSHHNW